MTSRIGMAIRAAARGIDDAFGWLVLWWPVLPVYVVSCALLIATSSGAANSFGIKFAAGLLTASFYFIVVFGGLASAVFFAGVTWKFFRGRGSSWLTQRSSHDFHAVYWLLGMLITSLWLAPLTLATANIPVVKDQILPF